MSCVKPMWVLSGFDALLNPSSFHKNFVLWCAHNKQGNDTQPHATLQTGIFRCNYAWENMLILEQNQNNETFISFNLCNFNEIDNFPWDHFMLLVVAEFDNTLIISISLIQVYQFHEILVDFIIVLNSKKEWTKMIS